MNRYATRILLCSGILPLLVAGTCVTVTNVVPGPDDDDGNPPSDSVTVRLINASASSAVDVQLYATAGQVSNVDTDLFIPANQIVAGIGFAGSGLLEAGAVDEVTLSCANAFAVGTRGGRFVDRDTGQELGVGTQRVLLQGLQFTCGDVLTFTYTAAGGQYETNIRIE